MLEQFIHIHGAEDVLVDNQIDRHFPLVELTDGHALATVKEKVAWDQEQKRRAWACSSEVACLPSLLRLQV